MKWLVFFYPWLELWSLIELGAQTSATSAMLWVISSGAIGVALFRLAGRQTLVHLQKAQREGALSQYLLMGNVAQLVAGVLLIVPGLISDVLAVAVLIAPLRDLLAKVWIRGLTNVHCNHHQGQGESSGFRTDPVRGRFDNDGVTLQGEFEPAPTETDRLDRHVPTPLERTPFDRD